MRTNLILSALFLVACSSEPGTGQDARARNQPPLTCSATDFEACPPVERLECPAGTEPVIDYASDCCAHFSCQPVCVAAGVCDVGPAPVCPPGTDLWIGTAIEDCCPAYRCEAAECDGSVPVACPLGMPYCGEGIMPVDVGMTKDCCPIYQCPCVEQPVRSDGSTEVGSPIADPYCGCTYPTCGFDEQLVCLGENICGYPCECQKISGNCMSDLECGAEARCDMSYCLPSPGCDPATGVACPAVCYGQCVPTGTTEGCRADSECPAGQVCQVQCMGWGCAPSSGGSDPSCTCPEGDYSCTCTPDGGCSGSSCTGVCSPAPKDCTTMFAPEVCPVPEMPCADAVVVGTDPYNCCPIYQCPRCDSTMGMPCAMPDCEGAVQVGTDPNTCCPLICCPTTDGTCAISGGSAP